MTTPYTGAELAAISALAEAATPGKWYERPDTLDCWEIVDASLPSETVTVCDSTRAEADARFIAACREDVPRLVAELTRAREALRLALPWVCAYVSDPPADEAQAALDAVVAALGEETDDARASSSAKCGHNLDDGLKCNRPRGHAGHHGWRAAWE